MEGNSSNTAWSVLKEMNSDFVQPRISLPKEIKRREVATGEERGANFTAVALMRFIWRYLAVKPQLKEQMRAECSNCEKFQEVF